MPLHIEVDHFVGVALVATLSAHAEDIHAEGIHAEGIHKGCPYIHRGSIAERPCFRCHRRGMAQSAFGTLCGTL